MNVYPLNKNSAVLNLRYFCNKFKVFCKQRERFKYKKTDSWQENFQRFNDSLTIKSYDIRTDNTEYQQKYEEKCQAKMTDNYNVFHYDDCHGTFKFTCCSTTSTFWFKQKNKREKRQRFLEKKKEGDEDSSYEF